MRKLVLAAFFSLCAAAAGYSQEAERPCDLSTYGSSLAHISHPPLKVIKKVAPNYPPIAKAGNISGEVVVGVVVDRKGDVVYACAEDAHPLLRKAAEEAARGWKYKWFPDFLRLNRRLKYLVTIIE